MKYNVINKDKIACYDSDYYAFITKFMDADQYKKWLSVQQSVSDKSQFKTILLSTCLRKMKQARTPKQYNAELKRLGLRLQGQRGLGKKPSKRGVVLQISIRAEKKHLAPKIKEFAKEICSDKEEKPQKTAFSYFNFIKKKTCI